MLILQVLPVVALAGIAVVILLVARGHRAAPALRWGLPAAVGAAFFAFSLITIANESLLQFWTNHTTTFAGNQVWFDLIIAVTVAFYLMAPRARAVGMPLLPWAIAVLLTACIALLPMLARMLWLEQHTQPRP